MKELLLEVAERSCVGARSGNEDCLAVACERGRHWCLVLSDGAGGHGDGALAAQLVVARVIAGFRSRPPVDGQDLAELLLDAHDALVAAQKERPAVSSAAAMHATVVALVIDALQGVALWGHVGDSRLYQWRGGRLNAVTRDDSVLQWVLDTGLVDPARADTVPNRSVLLAALGTAEEVTPHVSEPFALERSDAFLLCSDGWWDGLEPQAIGAMLADASSPEAWLEAMSAATLARGDPRQDNYSAIACWVVDALRATEAEPAAEPLSAAETWPPRARDTVPPR